MNEEKTQLNKNNNDPKMIHTYMSDMAEVVRQNEMSVIKVVVEEQKKKEIETEYLKVEGSPKKKLFWVIGGIIILLVALALAYFTLQKEKQKNIPPVIIKPAETLISYESQVVIDTTNVVSKSDFVNLLSKEFSERNTPETIKVISLNKTTNELTNTLSLENLLSLIKTNAPGQLLRSFSPEYMIGTYTPVSAYDRAHLFLIIKTSDYSQAYAGMLEWEKTMLDDLFSIFQINITGENKELFGKSFKDIVVKNKDVRILHTNDGADILLYLFQDKNTLVVTDNQEAVKQIITRLLAKQVKPL